MTVYISIGNSDGKLTQAAWSEFWHEVNLCIHSYAHVIHGEWVSLPTSRYQNACWAIETVARTEQQVMIQLWQLAQFHHQDSVAWADAPETVFLGPRRPAGREA